MSKIINFTGKTIEGTVESVIHPLSKACIQVNKVIFLKKDKDCSLCKEYLAIAKDEGIEVEIIGSPAPKAKAKKA